MLIVRESLAANVWWRASTKKRWRAVEGKFITSLCVIEIEEVMFWASTTLHRVAVTART